jgi:hypothetical protein
MKKFLKIILIVIFIIAVLLAGVYLYLRFMPEKSISNQKADFSLSATKLAEEYETNSTGSDRKFIDRIIEVTGVISEITIDQKNSVVFILSDKASSTGVLCTLNEKFHKKINRYKIGDTITVKGTCSGMLFEVVLNKCIIVD